MNHKNMEMHNGCPIQGNGAILLRNDETGIEFRDTLNKKAVTNIGCCHKECYASIVSGQSNPRPDDAHRSPEEILKEATEFFKDFYENGEVKGILDQESRMQQVADEIQNTGTYQLTYEELTYGARVAWRNSARCIARMFWAKLEVFDCRHVTTTEEMEDALIRHVDFGLNNGNIRSAITVFPQRMPGRKDFRMWNSQFFNYAGYEMADGTVVGDPQNVPLTKICQKFGWKGAGGRFDLLPLIVSAAEGAPKLFEIPKHLCKEVLLEHPKYKWFAEMGLKWFALPAVADMRLDIGGIEFTAAPFNGWYTSPEIGTRNFCDSHRYNISKDVANKMGLDTSCNSTLWKDQAMVQVNVSVLHSFQKEGVSLVDHHSAAEAYMKFMASEHQQRGGCPSDWVWLVPPISGGLTPLYNQNMISYKLKPSYEYQDKVWKDMIEELQSQNKSSQ